MMMHVLGTPVLYIDYADPLAKSSMCHAAQAD